MTTVQIAPQDVQDAVNFLQEFLTDEVPSGDYTQGTALHDQVIGAIATVVAFQRGDAALIRQMQSLSTIEAALGGATADPQALQDAVLAILSNWFVTQKQGSFSRGIGIAHFSQLTDVFVQPTIRFTYSPGLVFVADNAGVVLFIPQTSLIPVVDSQNVILEYLARIPLVAVRTGGAYDIDPAVFSDFDRFNPFVTRVENVDKFSGGTDPETTQQILDRAPTAISVRNPINERSIAAVIDQEFPEVPSQFVASMGTPEMQRDTVEIADHLAVHIGGAVDIYPLSPITETEFQGSVGALFARPDGVINVFRDSTLGTFPGTIGKGDILRIYSGFPGIMTPREFMIIENGSTQLIVSERTFFPIATDELVPLGHVSYTIGRIEPEFNDLLADVGGVPLATGTTSRQVQTSGRLTMPGGPVMQILDVAIINPSGGESAFVDPVDGFEHFLVQVNQTPSNAAPVGSLQFQTIIHNPLEAQSERMWMEIIVGTDTNQARFDGRTLRVRYKTIGDVSSIDGFINSEAERVVCANQLIRGHNPVVLQMTLQYRLRADAPSVLDNSVIARSIASFINGFDTSVVPLDVSSIVDAVKNAFPTIASIVLPFTITYVLSAPTGDILTYQTKDQVIVDPSKQTDGPVLDLPSFGVTPRTLRYLTDATLDVTVEQVF